ncbi:MAG: preprotein translocase subunit SecE [Clostridia bacterium]|nr:preprotein translocase subunit SecE [Clostridia bacterium]
MAEDVKVSKFANTRKNFVRFFKDVRSELKKVIWPSKSQLINNTATVLAYCLVVGIVIWIADYGLGKIVSIFLTGK